MDLLLLGDVAITLELVLTVIEFFVLVLILFHMRELSQHGKLEREEIREIRRLHGELREAVKLLKEDINELNENEDEMQDAVGLLKEDIKELNENQQEMHDIMKALAKRR